METFKRRRAVELKHGRICHSSRQRGAMRSGEGEDGDGSKARRCIWTGGGEDVSEDLHIFMV